MPKSVESRVTPSSSDPEEDSRRLPRVAGKIPWSSWGIILIEFFEKFAMNGTYIVFTNFLQQPLPPGSRTGAGFKGQSGALNLGQQVATGVNYANSFWMSTSPLFGAFIADQYLGRYTTIQWANFISLIGHVVLLVAALPPIIVSPMKAIVPFSIGLILMGVGFGGLKSNMSTLVVEQIPDTKLQISTNKKGHRVLVDPGATRARVLLYFYSMINIGSITGMISGVYAEKFVGFYLSFAVPTVVIIVCPLMLMWVRRRFPDYRSTPPSQSVLGNMFKLCALAMKGQWSWNPVQLYRNLQHPDFWNRVKPSRITNPPAWMTFEDSWIDEVSHGIQACKVFIWYPLLWPAHKQQSSNMTSQAATLRLGSIPNDLLITLNPLFCIILTPIYAHIIYPRLARYGIRFALTKRIALGFLSAAVAMACAATLQHFIYATSPCGRFTSKCRATANADSRLSLWYQLPVYFFIANSEVLAAVTGMQYAFQQAPQNMRSLVMALFLFTQAGASAFAQAMLPLSRDPLLVWNYTTAGGMCVVGAVGVWWCNRGRGDEEPEVEVEKKGSGQQGGRQQDMSAARG
ncbi:oligopeptide transporter [Massariosphaeria phaeospora]|uniref:Oligopeptide transporter n=1 Tax=Massariosphaeria phaeospora TaxID=100035 RepID=A0A7C8ID21_9PLEO|nr:oligopeptide transporter [Massariosphaeria phaeospora]